MTHRNCVVHTTIVNNADTSQTIRKGTKIAIGHTNFHQHSAFASEAINLISHWPPNQPTTASTIDPLDLLCSYMQHLRVFPRLFTHGGICPPPHMGDKCRRTKRNWGGLMRGDIDLMGGPNFDRLYHKLKVLLLLSCNYMMQFISYDSIKTR